MEPCSPERQESCSLSPAQRQAAINYLKQANLLERTGEDIGLSGMVGRTNRLIAWLVYSSRKLSVPLHLMFLGSSGSGKTYLQERVSELIPPEDKIEITQITENAFYYFRQDELRHKLLLIEDLDGAESSMYPLRELQSKRRISKTVTLKDSKGNLKNDHPHGGRPGERERLHHAGERSMKITPTAACCSTSMAARTRTNGSWTTRPAWPGVRSTGRRSSYTRQQLQHVQRVLKPVQVINPYAKYIQLPDQVFKPRRTMTLLLAFIEAITFYHQYQRPVKRDAQGHPYVETTVEDIEAAFAC
jgi:DNA primase